MSLLLMAARSAKNHGLSYATWNPSDAGTVIYLQNNNTRARSNTDPSIKRGIVRSTVPIIRKTYFELDLDDGGNDGESVAAGVCVASNDKNSKITSGTSCSVWCPSTFAYPYNNGTALTSIGIGNGVSGRFSVCVDPVTRNVWMTKVGVPYVNGGNPALGTSPLVVMYGTSNIFAAAEPYVSSLGTRPTCVDLVSNPANFLGTVPDGFAAGLK